MLTCTSPSPCIPPPSAGGVAGALEGPASKIGGNGGGGADFLGLLRPRLTGGVVKADAAKSASDTVINGAPPPPLADIVDDERETGGN